jgi:hypothetical protein
MSPLKASEQQQKALSRLWKEVTSIEKSSKRHVNEINGYHEQDTEG